MQIAKTIKCPGCKDEPLFKTTYFVCRGKGRILDNDIIALSYINYQTLYFKARRTGTSSIKRRTITIKI